MLDEIVKLINPLNKEIEQFSSDELLEMLEKLNRRLRRLDDNENVFEDNMYAGDLVSPTMEIKSSILEYLCQNMQKVRDKKSRAAMVYYILLNLHMFSNGNGRTSRFMYDLISENLSDENAVFYFHGDGERNDLEQSRGIMDIFYIDRIPDNFIINNLNFIFQNILEKFSFITCYYDEFNKDTEEFMETIFVQLTQKEINDLKKILYDSTGVKFTPGGIAMLYVAQKRGQLLDWIKRNEKNSEDAKKYRIEGRLCFAFENQDLLQSWTVDDFRDVIKIGNLVKHLRLKCIIDIFVEPEKFINIDTGSTYLNEILGISNDYTNNHKIK